MLSFGDSVLAKLDSDQELRRKHRRIYKILAGPDTPQRQRWLRAAEHAVRVQQRLPEDALIDWSKIDWSMVFKILVGLLSIFILFL